MSHRLFNVSRVVTLAALSLAVLLIADTGRYTGWPTQPALRWAGAQVSAPLIFDGVLLGFLLLQNKESGSFTERDPERLMAYAGPAALALHAAIVVAEETAGE